MSKPRRTRMAWLAVLALAQSCQSPTPGSSEVQCAQLNYFDQPAPGDEPVLFAPGMGSTDKNDDWPVIFTPDGTEAIMRIVGPTAEGDIVATLVHTIRKDGVWQDPEPLWFSNEYLDVEGFLALSVDGKQLFVSTARASWTGEGKPDRNIWRFPRVGSGWGNPVPLGGNIDTDDHELVTSVGRDGTIYFDREPRGGPWFSKSFYSTPDKHGNYQTPVEMASIPALAPYSKFMVSHDDSYLVMIRSVPTRSLDLFASFKRADGSWGEPTNLESINSRKSDKFPALSPDGKFLFFASRRTPEHETPLEEWVLDRILPATPGNQVDVYWVSTDAIRAEQWAQ